MNPFGDFNGYLGFIKNIEFLCFQKLLYVLIIVFCSSFLFRVLVYLTGGHIQFLLNQTLISLFFVDVSADYVQLLAFGSTGFNIVFFQLFLKFMFCLHAMWLCRHLTYFHL